MLGGGGVSTLTSVDASDRQHKDVFTEIPTLFLNILFKKNLTLKPMATRGASEVFSVSA